MLQARKQRRHEEAGFTDQGRITPEASAGDQMGTETWSRVHMKTQGQRFRRESKGLIRSRGSQEHLSTLLGTTGASRAPTRQSSIQPTSLTKTIQGLQEDTEAGKAHNAPYARWK